MADAVLLFVVGHRGVETNLRPALEQHFDVIVAHLRREALQILETSRPDIVLLDVPSLRFDLDKFVEIVHGYRPPISLFLLLGKGVRLDQVPRAEGFLRHPFSPHQLLRRLSRLKPSPKGEIIAWHDLQVDADGRVMIWNHQQVFLTPKQSALVQVFMRKPDDLITRAELMQEVWGTNYLGDTRTLDVHIFWFRKALQQLHAPFVLQTKKGQGYRFTEIQPLPEQPPADLTEPAN